MGGGSGWGTHVNPRLFHFNVGQNSLQIIIIIIIIIKIKLGINSKKINLQRGSIQTALYSVRFFMLSLMSVMSVYFTVHITGSFLSLLNEVESFSRV